MAGPIRVHEIAVSVQRSRSGAVRLYLDVVRRGEDHEPREGVLRGSEHRQANVGRRAVLVHLEVRTEAAVRTSSEVTYPVVVKW